MLSSRSNYDVVVLDFVFGLFFSCSWTSFCFPQAGTPSEVSRWLPCTRHAMHACMCGLFPISYPISDVDFLTPLDLFKEKKRRMKLNSEVTSSLLGSLAAGGLFRAGGVTCWVMEAM